MSLCPSNAMAAAANPGRTMFKNLARDCRGLTEEALTAVFKEVDDAVQSES